MHVPHVPSYGTDYAESIFHFFPILYINYDDLNDLIIQIQKQIDFISFFKLKHLTIRSPFNGVSYFFNYLMILTGNKSLNKKTKPLE